MTTRHAIRQQAAVITAVAMATALAGSACAAQAPTRVADVWLSCLPGDLTADQPEPAGPDDAVRFRVEGDPVLTIRPEAAPGRARLKFDDSAGDRGLQRLTSLPTACSAPVTADPVRVFDVFWTTYAENYPFFAAKGIDWQAVRDRYRPQVGPHTTDDQLFTTLTEMITPLGDLHTGIMADQQHRYAGVRPGTRPPTPEFVAKVDTTIAAQLPRRCRPGPTATSLTPIFPSNSATCGSPGSPATPTTVGSPLIWPNSTARWMPFSPRAAPRDPKRCTG